jgi:hypothetical protein
VSIGKSQVNLKEIEFLPDFMKSVQTASNDSKSLRGQEWHLFAAWPQVSRQVMVCQIWPVQSANQVLTNLAGMAVKFTERGSVQIDVRAGDLLPDGRQEVTFTVSDTGIAVPGDKRELLFRGYSQVEDSHSRSYGGIGLGLAISRGIVERMGGTIGFTGEEGNWSNDTVGAQAVGEGVALFGARVCSGKPLGVLVATATPVSNALPAQECEIALHSSLHRTPGKVPVMLSMALAVKNGSAKPGRIEVGGYGWQTFVRNRSRHYTARGAVKTLP